MRLRIPSSAIGLVLALAGVAGCGDEEMFSLRLSANERLIDKEATARLAHRDQGLEHPIVVGDLDGDGIDDAVLRSAFTTSGGGGKTVYGGAVYVLYGGSDVTGSIDLAGLPALIHVGAPSISTPPSGGVAAVDDIDGDGLADFVVSIDGIIGCDPNSPWVSDGPPVAGAWVVYGSATRLTGSREIKDVAALLSGPPACGGWNLAAALGDVDSDGKADFAVSKQSAAFGDPYEVFVFYGRGERLSGTVDLATTADATIREPGATGGLGGAHAYRVGDVDGDGIADFIVRLPVDGASLDARIVRGSGWRAAERAVVCPRAVRGGGRRGRRRRRDPRTLARCTRRRGPPAAPPGAPRARCLPRRGADAIERAVRVEVGEPPDVDDTSAIAVAVDCVADGFDAGVVVEVRPPGNPRRYRYALDWRAQPRDARPRLIGLAVAEAVDASRIELTAVPEPPIVFGPAPGRSLDTTGRAHSASDWRIAVIGVRRVFFAQAGVDLVGPGLIAARRLSRHLALSADLLAETATVLTTSGAVAVLSVSSAPRIAVRVGDRVHGELGAGVRLGIVRMRGEALPGSRLAGASQVRPWLGPAADVSVGVDVTPRLSLRASAEVGVVASGATARDLGAPVAELGGAWTSLGLAAAFAL